MDGFMIDAKGRHVPTANVKETDLLEDQTVQALIAKANDMHQKLADFKARAFDDFNAFQSILFEKYDTKRGGQKGNVTLMSFDGTLKIQVQIADNIVFGPELQVARSLIGECIADWSNGGNQNIRALVDKAFATDKEGKVNREALLGLRRLKMADPTGKWERAMGAITDSIRVIGSKEYMRFYRRENADAQWQAIVLDIAAISPKFDNQSGAN